MSLLTKFRNLLTRLHSKVYWTARSIRSRVHCWYIDHIWVPAQPEIVYTDAERAEATKMINEILQELQEEDAAGGVKSK